MSKIIQFKRGNTASNNTYLGVDGELTIDTEKKTLVVRDGTTPEGTPLAKESALQLHTNNSSNPHNVTKAQVGLGNVDNTADSSKIVASASKLTTIRTIALSGDVNGSVNFDGTSNVTITTILDSTLDLGLITESLG